MKLQEKIWIGTFVSLWVLVSTVSTFHAVEFFGLSNNPFFSWCIAIGFEIGAMASLGGLVISRGSKTLVWILFIILTIFQIHGNMYWAWSHAGDISEWVKLFDLVDEEPEFQKRIFAFISGGILPIVSLGFIKSLMDYLNPDKLEEKKEVFTEPEQVENVNNREENERNLESIEELAEKFKVPATVTKEQIVDLDKLGINVDELNNEFTEQLSDVDNITAWKVETDHQKAEELDLEPGYQKADVITPETIQQDVDLEVKKPTELNKLSSLINKAENTVNSIGEK